MNTPQVFTISKSDWHKQLPKTIRNCAFGSTIVCETEEMIELGRIAKQRICSSKDIWFCTKPKDISLISDIQ